MEQTVHASFPHRLSRSPVALTRLKSIGTWKRAGGRASEKPSPPSFASFPSFHPRRPRWQPHGMTHVTLPGPREDVKRKRGASARERNVRLCNRESLAATRSVWLSSGTDRQRPDAVAGLFDYGTAPLFQGVLNAGEIFQEGKQHLILASPWGQAFIPLFTAMRQRIACMSATTARRSRRRETRLCRHENVSWPHLPGVLRGHTPRPNPPASSAFARFARSAVKYLSSGRERGHRVGTPRPECHRREVCGLQAGESGDGVGTTSGWKPCPLPAGYSWDS
jgi:hypothetical protein